MVDFKNQEVELIFDSLTVDYSSCCFVEVSIIVVVETSSAISLSHELDFFHGCLTCKATVRTCAYLTDISLWFVDVSSQLCYLIRDGCQLCLQPGVMELDPSTHLQAQMAVMMNEMTKLRSELSKSKAEEQSVEKPGMEEIKILAPSQQPHDAIPPYPVRQKKARVDEGLNRNEGGICHPELISESANIKGLRSPIVVVVETSSAISLSHELDFFHGCLTCKATVRTCAYLMDISLWFVDVSSQLCYLIRDGCQLCLQAAKAEIQFSPKSHQFANSVLGFLNHAAGKKKERRIGEDSAAFAYIKRHRWEMFSRPLIRLRTQIVQEFYGNFSTAPRDGVFVRGISVNCSTEAIRAIWKLPRVSTDYKDTLVALHPNQPLEQAVLDRLAKEGANWEKDDQDNPLGFSANALQTRDLNLWHHFIYCNLMSTSYTAKVTYEQALLLYAIVTDTPFDAALVIRDQLTRCITNPKVKSWYFPVMITMLCRRAGVTFLSTDTEISLQQPLRLSKLDQRPPGASSSGQAASLPRLWLDS
ncbi:OLC1v1008663C1 [Oldenlandia corymbosa var. corymbosa]|uniref:OLC1v1008663C1 n=1 Tax=Oldenlandia corymbosa var. corymbosa TaxID=529605 RepID=A0AAV1DMP2_OLDCO|nr:OLC1v1008663C1 [Oldenlandia corymbosa var. corymbosa]